MVAKGNVRTRSHFTATAKDRGNSFRGIQAAAGRPRSPSPVPAERLLHPIRDAGVGDCVFDEASMDCGNFFLGGLRDVDSRRVPLPPLCVARPFFPRQGLDSKVSARAARSTPLGPSQASI